MFSINIMHLSYHQITKNMYIYEHNFNRKNAEVVVTNILFWICYCRNQRALNVRLSVLLYVMNDKKSTSHMAKIKQQINNINHKIYSYDQMSKGIVNLGSKKGNNNDNFSRQLS